MLPVNLNLTGKAVLIVGAARWRCAKRGCFCRKELALRLWRRRFETVGMRRSGEKTERCSRQIWMACFWSTRRPIVLKSIGR